METQKIHSNGQGPLGASRLAQWLLSNGYISESQLQLGEQEQRRSSSDFTRVLEDLGLIDQLTLARFLASEAKTEFVDLRRTWPQREAIQQVPHHLAKRFRAIPLRLENSTLVVAVADPFDFSITDCLERHTGFRIELVTAPQADIEAALERYYLEGESLQRTLEDLIQNGDTEELDESSVEEPPLIRLVDQMLARAVEIGASDIHVEPEEKMLRLRMRVDGVLHQELLVPQKWQAAVVARLKLLGNLDLTEHRLPQDGRSATKVGRHEINLRISTLPTHYGENVVVRLLDRSKLNLDLRALGLSNNNLEKFRSVLKQPHGVILITGPTGSGKTTTLYGALSSISSLDKSIFTLEDPIEYQLPIIRQTQINEETGMTFARGLRALLRQDPDVILVGETRDTETAQLMVRAALTGHLVFSTLHTNNAVDAIPRLLDMGVEPYLLPPALLAVVGQRLLRLNCPDCCQEDAPSELAFKEAGIPLPSDAPQRLWRGTGCPRCNGSGYSGRIPIFEILVVDETFHDAIIQRAGGPTFRRLAVEQGFQTLFDDGIQKVVQGKTTLEEVLRVVPVEKGAPPLTATPNL